MYAVKSLDSRGRSAPLLSWFLAALAPLLVASSTGPARRAAAAEPIEISIPEAKAAAAGIEEAKVALRTMQATITVPGRLRYDDRRHVEVKVAAAGIVSHVAVKPGDAVGGGDLLAIVTSPEVAQARAEVLSTQAQCEVEQLKARRASRVLAGLNDLLAAIRTGAAPKEVAKQLAGAELGSYRQSILSKYAAFKQAAALAEGASDPQLASVLPGREIQRRQAEFTTAAADLEAALESSSYQADLDARTAANDRSAAERQLSIRRQYLEALEGPHAGKQEPASESTLAKLNILAPFAGVVQSRTYSVSERVAPGDSLFVVADTSTLWVEADVREGHAGALALKPGDEVQVTVGATPARTMPAKVHYVGGQVSAETNAVSVIAVIENKTGELRPGQFVQVTAPTSTTRECVAVPSSAVVEHEGKQFVFAALGGRRYRRVDVTTGVEQNGWVETTKGLKPGDMIVVAGAFALKSEMLLEQFEE